MRRIRYVAALVAAFALTVSAVALAATSTVKVTGGTTKVTLSSGATSALSAAHLTAAAIAPATMSGSTATFPIAKGHINSKDRGVIYQKGGFSVSNGTTTRDVRDLTIVANGKTAGLYGVTRTGDRRVCARRARRRVCFTRSVFSLVKLANITGVTVSGTTATGTAKLTSEAAHLLNKLSSSHTFAAGQVIGSVTVTVSTSTTTTTTTTTSTTGYVDPLQS